MTTDQMIEESADEQNYRAIAVRITALDIEIDAARENLARYAYEHPLRVPAVRERINQLQAELESLESQRQRLLPMFAELKSRVVIGW